MIFSQSWVHLSTCLDQLKTAHTGSETLKKHSKFFDGGEILETLHLIIIS